MLNIRNILATSLFAVLVSVASQGLVLAQGSTTDLPVVLSMANKYIRFDLGVSGQAKGYDWQGTEQDADVAGRFNVVNVIGDPDTVVDDEQTLFGNDNYYPITQTFMVRVNNSILAVGSGGTWTQKPIIHSLPAPGTQKGITGPYMDAIWTAAAAGDAEPFVAKINVSFVRDQARIQITITNAGTKEQRIGLGIFMAPAYNAFPYMPGIGRSLSSGNTYYGMKLGGSQVPSMLEFFDNITNPGISARATFRNQDATVPDYVAVGPFNVLGEPGFVLPDSYNPDPTIPVTNQCGYAEYAKKGLARGASRTYVTYMGVGAATTMWTHKIGSRIERDHVALAVQGSRTVKYDSTDPGVGVLDSTPITIKAYVYNLDTDPGPYALNDVVAYLFLPKGLRLKSTSQAQTTQQKIGPVPINSEANPAVWEVEATGEYCGELEYYVSARDIKTGWQQIVSRKIIVPATRYARLYKGWQIMSVPYGSNDPSMDRVFGWSPGQIYKKTYDPTTNSYKTMSELEAGKAFWVYNSDVEQPLELLSDTFVFGEISGRQTGEQYVTLKRGWNMVGNPFMYPVYLGQLMVYNSVSNATKTFDDAVSSNWISRTVFWWNTDKSAYEYLRTNDSYIVPWRGYWVRATVPVTLVFCPSLYPASDVTTGLGGY